MPFEESGALTCADCGADITLEQYRRKIPRCDDCEADAIIASTNWPGKWRQP